MDTKNPSLPKYKKADDSYWAVHRAMCAVSNWTFGPFESWEPTEINAAIDNAREEIHKMLWTRVNKQEGMVPVPVELLSRLQQYAEMAEFPDTTGRTTKDIELTEAMIAKAKEE